jgi:hypothetical protein
LDVVHFESKAVIERIEVKAHQWRRRTVRQIKEDPSGGDFIS